MNEYMNLNREETAELADKLAAGDCWADDSAEDTDCFDIQLTTGRRVSGSYRWHSGPGEFIELKIDE